MPETLPDVDETGNPETPLGKANEKKKNKHLTYAALAIGGIGLALVMFKKKSSASGSASSSYGYPSLPAGAGGTGVDQSSLQNLTSAIQAGNTANSQAYQGLLSAIGGLRDTGTGGTPADQAFNPPQTQTGSGFGVAAFGTPVSDTSGSVYQQLPGASLGSFYGGGGQAFYEPTKGTFLAVPTGTAAWGQPDNNQWGLAKNTPLFQKVK